MRNSKQYFKIGVILFIIGVALYYVMQSDYMKQRSGSRADEMADVSTSAAAEEAVETVEMQASDDAASTRDVETGVELEEQD
jgi:uncharacterized protein (UPF0333 family)